MINGAGQTEAAFFRAMAQHDPPVSCIAHSRVESAAFKNPRLPGITGAGIRARPVQRHLGRNDNGRRRVQEGDAIGNCGHVPIRKRDQTPRRDEHLFSRRRLPDDLAVERARLHVEPPVVLQQVGMREPEGLIVDEELNDFAVGHVEDRLPGFREAIGIFCIDNRPGFIESVDKGAVLSVRTALLRAPAHADISVAEREHRFKLGQEVGSEVFFDDIPFVGGVVPAGRAEASMADHRAEPRGRSIAGARRVNKIRAVALEFLRPTGCAGDWLPRHSRKKPLKSLEREPTSPERDP